MKFILNVYLFWFSQIHLEMIKNMKEKNENDTDVVIKSVHCSTVLRMHAIYTHFDFPLLKACK